MACKPAHNGRNATDAEYLNRRGVADLLQTSVRWVSYRVAQGDFPRPLKIGNLSRWRRRDILDAVERLAKPGGEGAT